jgi:hypothetical protein
MVLAGIAIPCGALLLLLFLAQDRFIYIPTRALDGTPAALGLRFEEVSFRAEDGVALHGWHVPAAPEAFTVLLLHGNAGNISHRLDKVAAFSGAGLAVLIVDYRGYGRSEGTPGEEGLFRDARAAWRHLTEERGTPPGQVIVYGESLGCAPALRLAAALQREGAAPAALVLEAPFSSAAEMSRLVLPWLPVAWLLRSRFDNLSLAAQVTVPALVLVGEEDEVVPASMGRRIHAALGSSSKALHVEPGAGHNDLWLGRAGRLASLVERFARERAGTAGGSAGGG